MFIRLCFECPAFFIYSWPTLSYVFNPDATVADSRKDLEEEIEKTRSSRGQSMSTRYTSFDKATTQSTKKRKTIQKIQEQKIKFVKTKVMIKLLLFFPHCLQISIYKLTYFKNTDVCMWRILKLLSCFFQKGKAKKKKPKKTDRSHAHAANTLDLRNDLLSRFPHLSHTIEQNVRYYSTCAYILSFQLLSVQENNKCSLLFLQVEDEGLGTMDGKPENLKVCSPVVIFRLIKCSVSCMCFSRAWETN